MGELGDPLTIVSESLSLTSESLSTTDEILANDVVPALVLTQETTASGAEALKTEGENYREATAAVIAPAQDVANAVTQIPRNISVNVNLRVEGAEAADVSGAQLV